MKQEVLKLIHEAQQAIEKCRLRARTSVFWYCINQDIDVMIPQCSVCQHNQKSQQKEPIIHIEAEEPWKVIGTNLLQWKGKGYIIVVDYFSSYPIIRKLSSTTTLSMINSLRAIFSEYRVPDTVISDNGTQYTSEEFRAFSQCYGFAHIFSSPNHKQANSGAKRYVDVVKKMLQKCLESGQDPHMAMLCICTTPIGQGLPSPAEIIFRRKIPSNLPAITYDEIRDDLCQLRTQHISRYNDGNRTLSSLTPGDCVRVQDHITKKWKPGIIDHISDDRSYMIRMMNGALLPRNWAHICLQGEKLPTEEHFDEQPEPLDTGPDEQS